MRVVWNDPIFRLMMLRDTTIAIALIKFEIWSRMHLERAKYFFLICRNIFSRRRYFLNQTSTPILCILRYIRNVSKLVAKNL